jgi:hypothetical protein
VKLPSARRTSIEAFGIPVELPDLLLNHALRPARAGDGRTATVVTLADEDLGEEWGEGAERVREERAGGRVVWSVDVHPKHGFRLEASDRVTMLVTFDGLSIRCAPKGPVCDRGWAALIPAQALPLAATLRGLEVLHASAVNIGDRSLAFCGPAGVGKSSLATQLILRGAGLLTDDALAIDDALTAHPATGAVHVRPAELALLSSGDRARLGITTATRFDGRALGTLPPAAAAPLKAVFLLERATQGAVIESLDAIPPQTLLGLTFNLSVQTPDRLTRHLDFCARLAHEIPAYRVCITPESSRAELTDQVLKCL